MNKHNSIILGIGALLALLVSLPLEWMTIYNVKMQFNGGMQGFDQMMPSPFGPMTASVTGLNGHVTFLLKMPIWLIVIFGLLGIGLALLKNFGYGNFKNYIPLIPLSLSTVYVLLALLVTVTSSDANPQIGLFLALVGLVMGYIYTLKRPVASLVENSVKSGS